METQSTNLGNDDSDSKDLPETSLTYDETSSTSKTDGAIVGMIQEHLDTLNDAKDLFSSSYDKSNHDETSLADGSCACEFTESLKLKEVDLTQENFALDQSLLLTFEEKSNDNKISNPDTTCASELTESLKLNESDSSENKNVTLGQTWLSTYEDTLDDIFLTDNTCAHEFTESLTLGGLYLTENQNVALNHNLSPTFGKISNGNDNIAMFSNVSIRDNACAPEFTESLTLERSNLTENYNLFRKLYQNRSPPFEENADEHFVSRAENPCTPELTESFNSREFDLTENGNMALDLLLSLEEVSDDNKISHTNNICLSELTESVKFDGSYFTASEKWTLDQTELPSFEERSDSDKIPHTDNTCAPEFTESLKFNGFDLTENDYITRTLYQNKPHPFEENTEDHEISLSDNTCAPDFTEWSNSCGLDMAKNDSLSRILDQNRPHPSEDNMDDYEFSFIGNTCAPDFTESFNSRGLDMAENENLTLDLLPSFEEISYDDNKIYCTDNTCAPEFTELLTLDGCNLAENESLSRILDQNSPHPSEDNTDDHELSFTSNTCALHFTESLNLCGLNLVESENLSLDQLHSSEEKSDENQIFFTDNTCAPEFTESFKLDGSDLTVNDTFALNKTMLLSFEEKSDDGNKVSLTGSIRTSEFTDSLKLNLDETEVIDNENVALDQNIFSLCEEKTENYELTLTDNTCAPEFTESLNSDGFDLTENEHVALVAENTICSTNGATLNDNADLSQDSTQLDKMYLSNADLLPSMNLSSSDLQVLSNVSPNSDMLASYENSDSDVFPSHVFSPCPILPQEMNILSPVMTSSVSNESNFFKIFLSENNKTDTQSDSIQNQKSIGHVAENNETDTQSGTIQNKKSSSHVSENNKTDTQSDTIQNQNSSSHVGENNETDTQSDTIHNKKSISHVAESNETDTQSDTIQNQKSFSHVAENNETETQSDTIQNQKSISHVAESNEIDTQLDTVKYWKSIGEAAENNVTYIQSDIIQDQKSSRHVAENNETDTLSLTIQDWKSIGGAAENNETDTLSLTIQDWKSIGQAEGNNDSRIGAGNSFLLSENENFPEDMNPRNIKQQLQKKCSEQFFIDQILQRIHKYQTNQDIRTEIHDPSDTGVLNEVKASSVGENLRWNVGQSSNNSTYLDTRCLLEGPRMMMPSAFEYQPQNSNNSSSGSNKIERVIKENSKPANIHEERCFSTKKESPFWHSNVKNDNVKADISSVRLVCENYNDNSETANANDLSKIHKSEQRMASSEDKMKTAHSSRLSEISGHIADGESVIHDNHEMLTTIKKFRRLSTRDDFNKYCVQFGLRVLVDNVCSDDVSFRTNVETLNPNPGTNDLSVKRECKKVNEMLNDASNKDLMCDTNKRALEEESPNVNASVLMSNTMSGNIKKCTTVFNNQNEMNSNSEIFTRNASLTPFIPLLEVSKEDKHLVRNDKTNMLVKNNKRRRIIVPDRGIFKRSKGRADHSSPKRVSFLTDNSFRGSDKKSDLEMVSYNISDNDVNTESSNTPRALFSVDQLFNYNEMMYNSPQSFDMNRFHRYVDRFRRVKSFPEQAEFYFPYRDTCIDSTDHTFPNLTAFDEIYSKEKISLVKKHESLDSHLDKEENKNESLDGATNLAFLSESPTAQCLLQSVDDSEEDSCDEIETSKLFLPKDKESQSQNWRLFEKDKVRLSSRQHSPTELQEAAAASRSKSLRLWYSLSESVSKKVSLTNFSTLVTNFYDENIPSSGDKFSSKEDTDMEETALSSSVAREHPNKDDKAKEEDNLSLEFFVPGKHKYIRLHRTTFIHFVLKYSIFFFTFLFWIASVTGLSFCAWMLTSNTVVIDDVSDVFLDPYVLMCVVSGTIFLVAFFGCVGALRENICLLQLFHISLIAVLVLEVLLSAIVFLFYTMPEFRKVAKVGPEEVLKKAVKEYLDNEVLRNWIDMVQKEFQCCGVSMSNHGYLDWQENPYYNCSPTNPSVYRCSVPLSCCIFMPGDYINYMCGAGVIKKEEYELIHIINTKGCMKSFGEWLGKNDAVIGYIALGVIVPQILGVMATRFFIKNLKARRASCLQQGDPVQIVTSS